MADDVVAPLAPTKPTKVIQIVVFAPLPPLANRRGMLFALDDTGAIWWADFDKHVWSLVADITTIVNPPPFLVDSGGVF